MSCPDTSACAPPLGGAPPINAQRLVVQGYKGCLRRNYLIQIKNDDLDWLSVGHGAMDLVVFQYRRLTQWLSHGILPRAIFYSLLKQWLDSQHLATTTTPVVGAHTFLLTHCAYAIDIGLTFDGFQALEAHTQLTDLLRKKAPAYAQGALLRASSQLGDTGPSASTHWGERYQKDQIHAVLVVHSVMDVNGDATAGFAAFELAVLMEFGLPVTMPIHLLREDWIEQSAVLGTPREVHFGYTDGLSAPFFEDISEPAKKNSEHESNVHQRGELLLGYAKNDKSNPWAAPGAYAQETTPAPIRPVPVRIAYAEFFRDGSFGVLRNVKQNVAEFEDYVAQEARGLAGAQNLDYIKGWVKAKILGRWPNGELVQEAVAATYKDTTLPTGLETLLVPGLFTPPGTVPPSNKFGHHKNDPLGLACPLGAHIRRMNPRDDPVVPILRRPLLRRGAPYGKLFNPKTPDDEERGLLGLFFCSSIEEQFEHVLGNWANNNPMGLPYSKAGKDPLVGNQDSIGNSFQIPVRAGPPLWLNDLPTFVQTRGTCYAFFPSVNALKKIACGGIVSANLFLKSM